MAVPFKAQHFRLDRNAVLASQISASPLFQRIRKNLPEAGVLGLVQGLGPRQMSLPDGTCGRLDSALAFLRTRARLTIPIKTTLLLTDDSKPTCVARRNNGTLHLIVTGRLLETADDALLRHRLATAIFSAFHPLHDTLSLLLAAKSPMDLELWLNVTEYLRLSAYMAECFSAACLGDVSTPMRGGFLVNGACDPRDADIDLRRLGEAQMASGQFSVEAQILAGGSDIGWLPAKPAVLDAFMASEIYAACNGLDRGMPRAAFEAAVLGLDRRAHPPLVGPVPDEVSAFIQITAVLMAFALADATVPLTRERIDSILTALEIDETSFEKLCAGTGWDPLSADSAFDRLTNALGDPGRRWTNLLSVEIFNRALVGVLTANDGQLSPEMDPILFRIGSFCQLSPNDIRAILETFLERAVAATQARATG